MDLTTGHFTGAALTEAETCQALPDLRWSKDGKLQQAWGITVWRGLSLVSERVDWRDVPTEQ